MSRWLDTSVAGFMLLASAWASMPQRGELDLTIEAPPSLAPAAGRVRSLEREQLAAALGQAGLHLPARVHVTLVPEDDARARATPRWIVGRAFGSQDVVIFPARVGSYPYGSLESVVWHEVVHLALSVQAGGRPLPRWFHEGVAMSVEKGWGLTSQVRLLLATAGDPDLADLGRLFDSEAQLETASAYLLAAALMSDVRRRHGAAAPGAIVDRVARGTLFAHAFELQTGDTPDEAAGRAWGLYRRWTSWIPVVTSGSAVWIAILALAFIAFVSTLRRRARHRRQWDEEETDAHDGSL